MTTPIEVYTGTQVWIGRPTIRPAKKGRVEHGPGLYFTTSLTTALRYARGGRTVLKVELDPSISWLEDAKLPVSAVIQWLMERRGLRNRSFIIADVMENALRTRSRTGDMGLIYANALVNLMVNWDAITGDHGPALAEFLVWYDIDASHVSQSGGEEWIVLFNPKKVLRWEKVHVDPETPYMLPRVRGSEKKG